MPRKRKVLNKWFSAAWSNSVFSYFVIQWILRWASASQDLPSVPVRHRRTAFWIERNHLPGIHFSHCCQKFVWIMFGKKRKFLSGTVVYLCATTPYHSYLSSLSSSSWSSVASSRSSRSAFSLLLHLGPVSRKSRKLFGPEKPFVNMWPAYSVKLVFSYVVNRAVARKILQPRHYF